MYIITSDISDLDKHLDLINDKKFTDIEKIINDTSSASVVEKIEVSENSKISGTEKKIKQKKEITENSEVYTYIKYELF